MDSTKNMDKILVSDIHCSVIVGINPAERVNRQNIIINLTMFYNIEKCGISDDIDDTVNYATITSRVCDLVENQSAFYTIEAMATTIARIICMEFHIEEVIVRIDKPAALMKAKAPGIEIRRSKDFFLKSVQDENSKKVPSSISGVPVPTDQTVCYLGVGSNLGDRTENIHKAIALLQKFVVVLETSFLYETKPQYIVDQPLFINAVVKVSTKLDPVSLLKEMLQIEEVLGRQKVVKYGPRVIDLDILFYGNLTIKTPELVVPHPLIQERDFVLGPLNDIASEFVHPVLKKTISELNKQIKESSILKVLPLGKSDSSLLRLGNKTFVMGVLNVTPDSFSDGGKFVDVQKAVEYAFELQNAGCDILDIGGQSTKPGAEQVSEEEELKRVVPVLTLLKEKKFSLPISIDTFYAKVAKTAIELGAGVINDVTGGNFDPQMFSVVAEARVPIIIMHTRGDPKTMSSLANYKNVTEEVKGALLTSAFSAQTVGVFKWHIILDPGLGYAKHKEHSLTLLREGHKLKELGHPLLFGPSKKGFLGGKDTSVRDWRTAAAVTASVQQGADIVRVHDVKEMKDVVEVADSIYRHQ